MKKVFIASCYFDDGMDWPEYYHSNTILGVGSDYATAVEFIEKDIAEHENFVEAYDWKEAIKRRSNDIGSMDLLGEIEDELHWKLYDVRVSSVSDSRNFMVYYILEKEVREAH